MSKSLLLQNLAVLSDISSHSIGGKGMGLLHLRRLGMKGVPAWVIPTTVFATFMSSLGIDADLQALEKHLGSDEPPRERLKTVRQAILDAPLPENLLRSIRELQNQWAEEFGSRMIIRSSATVEDNVHRSFAGIFESIPCESDQEVQEAVHRVWASVFSPRAFAYYGIASLQHVPDMALVIQPFIEADRSGVMFTRFFSPQQEPQILVEHVEGGGEKLVTGRVNPERLWMPRWPEEQENLPETGLLAPHIALELSEVAKKLEDDLGPQDVEWCLRDDELFIVQTRPITTGGNTASTLTGGEVLLQGVGASQGRAGGVVHLVFNIEDADSLQIGQVLTTTMTNPDMVPSMQRSAAVVTDVGGMICHAAIVSRELGIPCVVGTKSATQVLPEGSVITVDGGTGVILRGLIEQQSEASAPKLQWDDLWQAWQAAVPTGTIPVISTYHALATMPGHISTCVLDPYCDLILDPLAEIDSLTSLGAGQRKQLLHSFVTQLTKSALAVSSNVYLDLHRLAAEIQIELSALLNQPSPIQPLKPLETQNEWSIRSTPDDHLIAVLDKFSPDLHKSPENTIRAVPLGFGLLLGNGPIEFPTQSGAGPEGMFGMMPEVRMARMPARERREAMHSLIPALSQAHGGQVPVSDQEFPWLDLRPEVVITPYLKAFVTPGVEAIPYKMGFPDPPLNIQFMRCRFHFRQDTLFGFFPKLMQMTWDEDFLSNMLKQCRATYDKLETLSATLPANEAELAHASDDKMHDLFVAWWNAFSEFFSFSFFIQAQGDDCVFPILGKMAEGNITLLKNKNLDIQFPGLAELSSPIMPVLTAEYIQDLLKFKQTLSFYKLENLDTAKEAIETERYSDLQAIFERVRERWHWMRERDPYYDPYDTPTVILEKALSIRDSPPTDYGVNFAQSTLALALHFDLARLTDTSEKIVYGVKYGRALAIDRENHHIVWLRTSYRLRKLLIEWESRLREKNNLQYRDIFFLQPWEILNVVASRSQPMPVELLTRLRNRRVAYEREIQLKTGRESTLVPLPEEDYY